MSDEYLWDRSGEPDPEIQQLERMLSVYRDQGVPRNRVYRRWPAILAIAASLVIGLAAWRTYQSYRSQWHITGANPQHLRSGQKVSSGGATVRLEAEDTGQVTLEPKSDLRVLNHWNLALQRGTMHAFIWAPPERFQVQTPSAKAVDLGCEYTLNVDENGSGLLSVQMGWVAFQAGANESFIPAGAACRTRKATGPGLPYFTDASSEFKAAVEDGNIVGILAASRPRDALTLWHLILRTTGADRERVATRFAGLIPGIDPASLSRGESAALDSAWNALGLGETKWWRTWKRKW